MSNNLDPDQAEHFLGPAWDPKYFGNIISSQQMWPKKDERERGKSWSVQIFTVKPV